MTPQSGRAFEEATEFLAGGVAADMKRMEPHPLYVSGASGARLRDLDGNEYIDLRMGASSLILGHAYPPVVDAVRAQLEHGLLMTLPTELDAALAAQIQRHMPHAERLRFVNSGSEATIMTVRVARAFTGRDLVAKFDGANHGNAHDGLFVDGRLVAGGDMMPVPAAAGLPRSVVDGVLVLPFNDIENTMRLIREHGPRLAAVITEPVPVKFPGGRSTDPEFLPALRQVTEEQGVLLVFDEMVTGFRLGLGGGAGYFGVRPDLVALGKVIGGGMPIGAYGGRADVMNRTVAGENHSPTIRQSGTHSAHPLSAAAGLAQLRELERLDPYPNLRARGERLRSGLAAACVQTGIDAQVMGLESIFVMRFRSAAEHHEFCLGLLTEGAFLAPGLAGYLSAAHTDKDIEAVIDAAGRVLAGMAGAAA